MSGAPVPEVVLASASPRRRRLLHWLGIPFEAVSVDTPEELDSPLASDPPLLAQHLAAEKALAARADGPTRSGQAFVCGLLHDLGKIALDACLPKSYARVLELVERHGRCICDVERDLLGLDHTTAGRHLVSRWKLPAPIVECVWLHHQDAEGLPSSVANPRLVKLIHAADNLVRRQRIGYSGYHHVGDVEQAVTSLGVDVSVIDDLAGELPQRMGPFCEFIGLDDTTSRTLYTESLTKANRELGRLKVALAALDAGHDLALLRLPERAAPYAFLTVATEIPALGESVAFFGSALFRHEILLTGTVARRRETFSYHASHHLSVRAFHVTAPSPPGTSGGPSCCARSGGSPCPLRCSAARCSHCWPAEPPWAGASSAGRCAESPPAWARP